MEGSTRRKNMIKFRTACLAQGDSGIWETRAGSSRNDAIIACALHGVSWFMFNGGRTEVNISKKEAKNIALNVLLQEFHACEDRIKEIQDEVTEILRIDSGGDNA